MIPTPMKYSKNGYKLTESFEACKLRAYPDTGGKWTIGWGHTRGVGQGLSCIQLQADSWLVEDVAFAEAAVNALVTVRLTQDEFDALVDFTFNVGDHNFKTSTMLLWLNAGNFEAAAYQFDKWDHVNGVEVAGLLRRREAERQEFLTAFGPGVSEGAD